MNNVYKIHFFFELDCLKVLFGLNCDAGVWNLTFGCGLESSYWIL